MKLTELNILFRRAVTSGAQKALSDNGLLATDISKVEAYRLYGRSHVDRWIKEGLIVPISNGKNTKNYIDNGKLAAIAARSNRITYLPVADRKR